MKAGLLAVSSVGGLKLEHRHRQVHDDPDALAKGCVAYEDFFTLWKNADGETPLLAQARAEYHHLH